MNLNELATALAERHGLSKRDATQYIRTFTVLIFEELGKGTPVRIAGFGAFRVVGRVARTWTNPRTGQLIAIPPQRSIAFRGAPAVLRRLNTATSPEA